MATTAGEMREMLISAIEDVKAGKMDQSRAGSIAKLAQAVTESMRLEIEARRLALTMKKDGSLLDMKPLVIGDESPAGPEIERGPVVTRRVASSDSAIDSAF